MDQHVSLSVLSGGDDLGAIRPATIGNRVDTGVEDVPLRCLLRTATQEVHGRLHLHSGFAAVQSATITRADYESLLVRLYGFYVPFDAAVAAAPCRSKWLEDDLRSLGLGRALSVLPRCPHVPSLDNGLLRLGALYVVEGSALGGRDLARGLDRLLGKDVTEGRRFFLGRGSGTGQAWRHYLARLSAAPPERTARAEVVKGAVATFAAFEHWMAGWSTRSHG